VCLLIVQIRQLRLRFCAQSNQNVNRVMYGEIL